MSESDPYSEVTKVISVNILYFDLGYGSDYIYHGTTSFRGIHLHDELELNDSQKNLYGKGKIYELFPEYYLLRINNFDDIAKTTLDEWIYFLKNEEVRDEFSARGLQKAREQLDIMKLPEEERAAYNKYVDDLHYKASIVESSYGIGRLEGHKEGHEQGHKEGHREGIMEVALRMVAAGMSVQEVAKLSGVAVSELEKYLSESQERQD
jgi:predicted transposase/invertase (TIGR01784 family)